MANNGVCMGLGVKGLTKHVCVADKQPDSSGVKNAGKVQLLWIGGCMLSRRHLSCSLYN